ncbi:hypothetical protein HPO96_06875 [Kribbella sandramycini]|uniref:Lysylphosphatidylglycerol synthetase-like protein (DUF2156 family) n=1 Tax=Kribbella sandramycini TaxID=60450 RepID=A0A7Y4KYE8_9ACTN|nr:hypothetical protein [Kribbella sandramycini]MBB6567428.1 lysylphosphatidylglycerol synthetase-like protein (DUF2156 family) [Kribbella sandramycini]NOL39961.1 hypothetical protein [Kribbella sandramycini]
MLKSTRSTTRPATSLWFLMAADLMAVVWMHIFGPWLDHSSRFTSTATLGGHHLIVMIAAAIGFAMLAALAILTEGFTKATTKLTIATNVACVISVIALAGLIALILAALLSRLIFGKLRP